jgi:hypothetical protein
MSNVWDTQPADIRTKHPVYRKFLDRLNTTLHLQVNHRRASKSNLSIAINKSHRLNSYIPDKQERIYQRRDRGNGFSRHHHRAEN